MRTYGFELEVEGVAIDAVKVFNRSFPGTRSFDDRSVRGRTHVVDGIPIRVLRRQRSGHKKFIVPSGVVDMPDVGLEIISAPLYYDKAKEFADFTAVMLGHVPQTTRASIHIHADVGNRPWTYVRNLLQWCYHLEAILYRIASGCGQHRGNRYDDRGEYNDYRFCRPLSAPIAIEYDTRNGLGGGSVKAAPMFAAEDLFEAKSFSELLAVWGRLDYVWSNEGRGAHYIPQRLMGFNPHSVLRLGTFEFRLFDAIYAYTPVFLDVVHSIMELAESGPPSFSPITITLQKPDVQVGWIESLFGEATALLWKRSPHSWPSPVSDPLKLSHYADRGRIIIPDRSIVPIFAYVNNDGSADSGSKSFVPFVRR